MKRLIALVALLIGIISATTAQNNENKWFDKGYTFNVELSATDISIFHITSSHGWAFGNGLFVGGGAGFGAEWADSKVEGTPHYVPSLFVNARWSILNKGVSPFVDLKAGQYIDLAAKKVTYGINPSVGIDFGRFALGIGYMMREQNLMQVRVGFCF